ncbi:MAG: hypothetical protein HY804_01815 [Nitrospinae bacterium]|nr:hypothetical protein [Nitrospinota bacterium]
MNDFLKRMREQALATEQHRHEQPHLTEEERLRAEMLRVAMEVAHYLGWTREMVENCCGSVCPHCELFLDKALALMELGYPHHLFLNPMQEEVLRETQELFRRDRKEYEIRKEELMNRMKA